VVSSEVFAALDKHMWRLTYKWARHSHPNKSKHWVTARYFGTFNPTRRDKWIFGDRDSGAYLHKFAWTAIVRHQLVKGAASTDDPALTDYWAQRRRRRKPPLNRSGLRLLTEQRGRCPLCGDFLLHADHEPQHPDEWEQWLKATRKAVRKNAVTAEPGHGTSNDPVSLHLVHTHCRRRRHTDSTTPALPLPASPQGLA